MSEIKRWMISAHDWDEEEFEQGEWVKFEDYKNEIEKLKLELDRMQNYTVVGYAQVFDECRAENEKLKKQLEVCRVSLEFYANESKYEKFINVSLPPSIKNRERIEIILDNGKRARQALAELEKMK